MKQSLLCRVFLSAVMFMVVVAGGVYAQHPAFGNNPFFGRNDPSKYRPGKQPHGGAGYLDYMELTPRDEFRSNFIFLHRGILRPKSGIGEHAHRKMEEMYFVFDRYAEFTVNGITAEIPAIGMVLCRMGDSHGIYNPTNHPVEWMNFGVSNENQAYDAVNYNTEGGDLVDQMIVSPPPFMWAVLSKDMLRPVERFYGGKGTVRIREVWDQEDFRSYWAYIHHYLVPPGCSIGLHRHDEMEVVYYILKGTGRGTINDATYDIMTGDALSCTLHHAIGVFNNSQEDLEVIACGVSMVKGALKFGTPLGDDLTGR